MILNIDHTWTALVRLRVLLLRRPQVSTDPPPIRPTPSGNAGSGS